MLIPPFFLQCTADVVRAVRRSSACILPVGPCLYNAGRNHEPHGWDAAFGGAAHDDQANAGEWLQCQVLQQTQPLTSTTYCQGLSFTFYKHLFGMGFFFPSTANTCIPFCIGDLESLLHWPHRVTRGHRRAQMDCLHFPQSNIFCFSFR